MKLNSLSLVVKNCLTAAKQHYTWFAIIDNTSILIVLNSSKHPHAPACDKPLNRLPTLNDVICFEQLNTYTGTPNALPKSLVVSVFPVPAGP